MRLIKSAEFDVTSTPQSFLLETGDRDIAALQMTWVTTPGAGLAEASIAISADGEGYVKALATNGSTKSNLSLAVAAETVLGRNYDLRGARFIRVEVNGTATGGRVLVTLIAEKKRGSNGYKRVEYVETKVVDPADNDALYVPTAGTDVAGVQVTAAANFSGSAVFLPEQTIDGRGWTTAFKEGDVSTTSASDFTLTGTPITLVAGQYQTDCLTQFRLRLTSPHTGTARLSILTASKE